MYNQLFSKSDITDISRNLETRIFRNPDGCAVKLENQSRFAIDVYNESLTEQIDRIQPYSFSILANGEYNLKVNKDIKSDNVQESEFISTKLVQGDTSQYSGQIFNGTAMVSGDMNVIGGQIDAFVQGDITLAPDTTVNANVTGDVNIVGQPQVQVVGETNVTINGTPQVELVNPNVNIANVPTVTLSGDTEINANIQNAQIQTEVINSSIGVNNFIYFGEATVRVDIDGSGGVDGEYTITTEQIGVYDALFFMVEPVNNNPEDFNDIQLYTNSLRVKGSVTSHWEGATNQAFTYGFYTMDTPATFTDYVVQPAPFNEVRFSIGYMNNGEVSIHNDFKVTVYVFNLNKGAKYSSNTSSLLIKDQYGTLVEVDANNPIPIEISNENFKQKMRGVDFTGGNPDTITLNGVYSGYNLVGLPTGITAGFIEHSNYRADLGDTYALQILHTVVGDKRMFTRRKVNGVWEGWNELIVKGDILQSGEETVAVPTANTLVTKRVTFAKPFRNVPSVVVSANTGAPQNVFASTGTITTTYVDINVYRTTAVNTVVRWIATERTQ